MTEKKKEGKSGEEEKKLDFKKFADELANLEDKQHINQLGPALTKEYLDHALFTDKDGVQRFRDEFDEKEAHQLADKLYDGIGYHIHRRFLKMDKEGFDQLKKIKDPNGNSYMDIVSEYHTGMKRHDLKKMLGRKKKGNRITLEGLQKILEQPIGQHAQRVTFGLLDKEHLRDPKNAGKMKGAIDEIIKEFKLDQNTYNTAEMYDHQEILNTYVHLVKQHYTKGAHSK